jgi:hypothetical protein
MMYACMLLTTSEDRLEVVNATLDVDALPPRLAAQPDPYDRLTACRQTPWQTVCWSDPQAGPIEAFGPPPAATPPPATLTTSATAPPATAPAPASRSTPKASHVAQPSLFA